MYMHMYNMYMHMVCVASLRCTSKANAHGTIVYMLYAWNMVAEGFSARGQYPSCHEASECHLRKSVLVVYGYRAHSKSYFA